MPSPRFIHWRERRNFRYATLAAFLLAMGVLAACKTQYRDHVVQASAETSITMQTCDHSE